jgi:hypothetical protein
MNTVTQNTPQPAFDSFAVTYPDTVTEVYTYKKQNITVATVTIVYTDTTKVDMLSFKRSWNV